MGSAGPKGVPPAAADPTPAIREVFGPRAKVDGLRPLSSGASRRSWRFDLTGDAGRSGRYVIQQEMTPTDPAAPSDLRTLPMTSQAKVLAAAARAGVPVAPVVGSGSVGGLGFLISEELDGEALPPRLLRDPAMEAALARLERDCASALAAVHGLEPDGLGLAEQDRLALYRRRLDEIDEPRPVLELAYRWLIDNRPPARPPVVVHGDFRLGNLLVGPAGLRAVLDWELTHLGDPHEDVAWAMIRAWRFDRHRPPGVFPDAARWPDAYDRAAGPERRLDRAALAWWQIAGTWCWAVISAVQARRHLDGWVRSLEHAIIGRRVCESEWDLLELLP